MTYFVTNLTGIFLPLFFTFSLFCSFMAPEKLQEVARADFKPSNQVCENPRNLGSVCDCSLRNIMMLWFLFVPLFSPFSYHPIFVCSFVFQDILRCRVLTSGIFETKFVVEKVHFQ